MLTCLWRVICPENLLVHEEGMVSLLSDTRTHLPEAPGHPFLRARLTEKMWPLPPSAAADRMTGKGKRCFPSSSGDWKFRFDITG